MSPGPHAAESDPQLHALLERSFGELVAGPTATTLQASATQASGFQDLERSGFASDDEPLRAGSRGDASGFRASTRDGRPRGDGRSETGRPPEVPSRASARAVRGILRAAS